MLKREELTKNHVRGRGGLLCGQSCCPALTSSQGGRGDRQETNNIVTSGTGKTKAGGRGWRIMAATLGEMLWEGLSEEVTRAEM